MEGTMMKLSELPPGRAARVMRIEECAIARRLRSLGMTEGASVVRLYSAAAGDPTAYLVRGSVVALRARDAERVTIWV